MSNNDQKGSNKSQIKLGVQKLNRQIHAKIDRMDFESKVRLASELGIELPNIVKQKVKKYNIEL